MNQLTSLNIILALLGFLLQILRTVRPVLKGATPFSFTRWIQENWHNAIVGLICTIAGVIMGSDLVRALGLNGPANASFYSVHAFMMGYAGREMIFHLFKLIPTQPANGQ